MQVEYKQLGEGQLPRLWDRVREREIRPTEISPVPGCSLAGYVHNVAAQVENPDPGGPFVFVTYRGPDRDQSHTVSITAFPRPTIGFVV